MPGPGACTYISMKTNKTTYLMRLENLPFLNILIIRPPSSAVAAKGLENIPVQTPVQVDITPQQLNFLSLENTPFRIFRTLRSELLVILCVLLSQINAKVISIRLSTWPWKLPHAQLIRLLPKSQSPPNRKK